MSFGRLIMRASSLLFVALVLGFATSIGAADDDAKQKAIKDEWKRRNGTWEPGSAVIDGKERPGGKRKMVLVYKDDRYMDTVGGRVVAEGTSKVDPTQNPKTLDITPERAGGKGKTALAIYKLEDDELTVCLAPPGQERPKEF